MQSLLDNDARVGVRNPAVLGTLQDQVQARAEAVHDWLLGERQAGRRVVGYGAASRAVALLLKAGVDGSLLPAVIDASPAKQGLRMPGTDIPIVDPAQLMAYQPAAVLLFVLDLLNEVRAAYPGVEASGGRWVDAESLEGLTARSCEGAERYQKVPGAARMMRRPIGRLFPVESRRKLAMKVLVAGDRGYIGAALTGFLRAAGHEVTGLDLGLYDGCDLWAGSEEATPAVLDMRDVEAGHLRGFDAVACLAALSNDPLGHLNPAATYSVNLGGTLQLARAAKAAGVERFVFASSCSLYGAAGSEGVAEDAPAVPGDALWQDKGSSRAPSIPAGGRHV